ncbi:kinase-like domain-containing protein [Roridomyces roridus]|uniref:Kinase-like domain-containing protein n=1 Tax=Roridomyces roridus TaxID=1738132 RepID=A0AAD7BM17_9AGAR|nr:kinase-like domain-containing protein [Roridomyces roridus]
MKLSLDVPPAALALAAREADHGDELTSSIRPLMYRAVSCRFGNTEEPEGGTTSVIIGHNPQIHGSGIRLAISYERNTKVLDCAENLALLEDNQDQGLDETTIKKILPKIDTLPGCKTIVTFETLADGSFHLESHIEIEKRVEEVLKPIECPSVLLSDLVCINVLSTYVYLVNAPCLGRAVFKIPQEPEFEFEPDTSFARSLEFFLGLPDVEFLIRPSHIVLDTADVLRGFLMEYYPASSLAHVLRQHRQNELTGKHALGTEQIPWAVKLAWATDIAAGVAWLHSQDIFWGDLKLANVVLCTDGHCRLIDYMPDGHTKGWCPPECADALPGMHPDTVEPCHDVFGLGLILWSLGSREVVTPEQGDRPGPGWMSEMPYEWFGRLVDRSMANEPGDRPTADHMYQTLVSHA